MEHRELKHQVLITKQRSSIYYNYKYVGETGRCLAERSREHIRGMENGDVENFIIKHWATCHTDEVTPPEMKFEVVKNHRDCLSRLLHEAVLIEKEGTMNSKSEWRQTEQHDESLLGFSIQNSIQDG